MGDLVGDVKQVLRNLVPRERKVKVADEEQTWHLMRILPYRTQDNVIDGVVITFTDLTQVMRADEAVARLAAIVESSTDAIISKSLEGVIQSWNQGAERLYGYTAAEAVGRRIDLLIPRDRQEEELQILEKIRRGERVMPYETVRVHKDKRHIDVSLSVSPVRDSSGRIIGAAHVARDVTERKKADAHQQMLIHELDHRVKNTLAMVTALAAQTAHECESIEVFQAAFEGRIHALAKAHQQLSRAQWHGANLGDLIRMTLAPHVAANGNRLVVEGPAVSVGPKIAVTLALVFHELATNAVKHGSLSNSDSGRVHVQWAYGNGAQTQLRIGWTERGGPNVQPPQRIGFGTRLIQRSIEHEIQGRVNTKYDRDGLKCEIEFSWDTEGVAELKRNEDRE
jgi:PAS domain S-box-containing protein